MGILGSREREGEIKHKNGPNEGSKGLGFREDEKGTPFKGIKTNFKCETCILAKSQKHSYSCSLNKAISPFMLIHSDVWGPTPETGIHGLHMKQEGN